MSGTKKKVVKKVIKKKSSVKITGPMKVTHALHIDRDLNWSFDKNVDPNTIFQQIKEIGKGGFGTVIELMHIPSSTLLAGKSINPEIVNNNTKTMELLKREIDLMRQIVSDYTIHYYGTIIFKGNLTILMEFCNLGSIRDLIDYRNKVLSEAQISIVMSDLLHALSILHDKYKIVHRDIKAANILLSSSGYCRVTDFGVSRQFSSKTIDTSTMIGTPYWMAPEVINEEKYSYEADVWSAGATAIECAIGAPPYVELPSTRAMIEIATNGFNGHFPFQERFSQEFVDFVFQCAEVNPKNRATVNELLDHPFIKQAESLDRMQIMAPLLSTQVDFAKLLEMSNEATEDEFETKTQSFINKSKSVIRTKHQDK